MILMIDFLAVVIIIIITSFSVIITFAIVTSKHSFAAWQFRLEIKGPREAGKGRQARVATPPCCAWIWILLMMFLCQKKW